MIAGFEGCFLYAYPDPGTGGEPITIGIGATKYDGAGSVKLGDRISFDRAVQRFRETLQKKYVPDVVAALHWNLTQKQLNAAASLHYNTGKIKSGTIDDKFNAGDDVAALGTWAAYNRAAGRVLPGLVTRRADEIRLWKNGPYPTRGILVKDTPGAKGRVISPANFPWDVDVKPLPMGDLTFPEIPPPPEKRPSFNFLVDLFNAIIGLFRHA